MGASTEEWVVGVCALLVVAATLSLIQNRDELKHVEYRFPAGFRGDWFVVPDRSLPPQDPGPMVVLDFDRRGLCRVGEGTYAALFKWQSSDCQVGTKDVDLTDPMDFVAGRVSIALGGYERSSDPELIKIAPSFVYGFVGDLKALRSSSATCKSNSERLRDLLSAKTERRR